MIKLICDICKKEVDRRNVCDEDGHATKDAMIDIDILDTYCRDYGGHYLICVDCYNNICDFINSRHKMFGWPKSQTKNPREGQDFNDYLAEQLKDPEFKKQFENTEIIAERNCLTCKYGNLYTASEPCCNCADDNDMYEPNEDEKSDN